MDSNCKPLVIEATTQPTAGQPRDSFAKHFIPLASLIFTIYLCSADALVVVSVTRSGDLLAFGQLLNVFGNT